MIMIDIGKPKECFICPFKHIGVDPFIECEPSNCPLEEIVRCKECRYYHADDYGYCEAWGDMFHHWEENDRVDPDGYCYMGKRRDEVEE